VETVRDGAIVTMQQ